VLLFLTLLTQSSWPWVLSHELALVSKKSYRRDCRLFCCHNLATLLRVLDWPDPIRAVYLFLSSISWVCIVVIWCCEKLRVSQFNVPNRSPRFWIDVLMGPYCLAFNWFVSLRLLVRLLRLFLLRGLLSWFFTARNKCAFELFVLVDKQSLPLLTETVQVPWLHYVRYNWVWSFKIFIWRYAAVWACRLSPFRQAVWLLMSCLWVVDLTVFCFGQLSWAISKLTLIKNLATWRLHRHPVF
jgi:hypothetical protein